MISPAEVRQKAERLYAPMLRAWLEGVPFFPQEIGFRKPQATDDYLALRADVAALLAGAKAQRGYGYHVELLLRQTRSYGEQSLPARILIETETDLLRLIKKADEAAAFKRDAAIIRAVLPQLEDWLRQNTKSVIEQAGAWPGLLLVCQYLHAHPRPHVYPRELPIPIHTKFIEEHKGILRRLLDVVLPPESVFSAESLFERRYGLRYDEPLIRLRLLDPALQARLLPVSDLSVPLTQTPQLGLAGRRCLIVENKLTFLTLPPLADTFAIFGAGFAVELLRHVPWLSTCPLIYWGDLDAQGFAILALLRSFQPHARSVMMDEATLVAFEAFAVPGTPCAAEHLSMLTDAEQRLFTQLNQQHMRLEQERIGYDYALAQLLTHLPPMPG